ncbi:SUN domain-containing protein 3-like [Gavia stellata]|uniref:SUN domain-containing protein 3-like n=1 Tax=Gavia stellata TaxID=37040 RepID=UPI0028977302|nr:SUN domain-containing protein 3-like [Gavia stellata]
MWEIKETAAHVSAARANILQAVREVLGDHGVQEEKKEEILQLTQVAIKNVLENYLPMPDWALEAIGATIEEERTSKSYGGQGKKSWWLSPFGFSSANPPETILQPHIAPGNCWAFQGSRGRMVIRLPEQIWPRAFTIWHISGAVSPSGEVSSTPKEFAVSLSLCLGVDEARAETLLGTFTYEVHKEVAQTFHVQKELPRTFRYIKFEVQSNWGNPEYTCVYRVQVHGKTAQHVCWSELGARGAGDDSRHQPSGGSFLWLLRSILSFGFTEAFGIVLLCSTFLFLFVLLWPLFVLQDQVLPALLVLGRAAPPVAKIFLTRLLPALADFLTVLFPPVLLFLGIIHLLVPLPS